jgi:SWI/SNF related-matrix-associated actin-dependent regulator of chromatin subfamily C
VNKIERASLPEFFGKASGKSPEVYVEFRDWMIRAYRANPSIYLTATACRRVLIGDVSAILRLHSFLEYWGLINFEALVATRPAPPNPAGVLVVPAFPPPDARKPTAMTDE